MIRARRELEVCEPLVVEFFGPAGAGKSTLLKGVSRALHDRGLSSTSHSQNRLDFNSVRRFLCCILGSLSLLRDYVSIPATDLVSPFEGKGIKWRLYLLVSRGRNLFQLSKQIAFSRASVELVEQGEYFFRSDMLLHGASNTNLKIPRTDKVIFLDVTEAEMISRLHFRGLQKGPESTSLAKNSMFRRRYRKAIRDVLAVASENVPTKIYDSSMPVSSLVKEITLELEMSLKARVVDSGEICAYPRVETKKT
jgi:thymidylate kinase